MQPTYTATSPESLEQATLRRSEELFHNQQEQIFKSTDRLFVWLMLVQWLAGIGAALIISPRTWNGAESAVHPHIWIATVLGGAISAFPIALALLRPGQAFTRYTIAVAQMLMSAVLIHVSGGRLETHFHIFGSLVILSFYRDWRVLIPATLVVALDHFVRGVYFPLSVYGALEASPWRSIEHAFWVLFEDVFLFASCVRSLREMREIAQNTAQLEITNQIIEEKVVYRTAEVKASEERFRLLVDGVQDYSIIMLDGDGRIVSWNEGAKRIQGYQATEIIGQEATRFYTKEAIEKGFPGRALVLASEHGRYENEDWQVRQDGSMFWAHMVYTALRDENGNLRGFSKLTRDITERKRAEDALKRAHDELETRVVQRTAELAEANEDLSLQKTILESQGEASIDGILIVSNGAEIVSYNRRFCEIWDVPRDLVEARSDESVLQSVLAKVENSEEFLSRVQYLYEHQDEKSQEEIVLKNGRILDRYSAPVRGTDGTYYGRIWFFRDITDRKQDEAAIHQAKEEAEQANRAKSEFLSRMSHELRTPLNAILGFGQLLEMGALEPEDREAIEHILKAGRHLLTLINEVLEISRIEAGRMSLSPEPIPVFQVAKDALSLVMPLANAQGIKLINKVEQPNENEPSVHVFADQQRLKQVLLNLLANAVKYNRPQGQVTLSCEAITPLRLRFVVSDTGQGLSAEDMGKIFVPFERLHAANSSIEGTGIGLALSKRLVEAMGGQIGVESTVGEGSRFWVELPLSKGPLDEQQDLLKEGDASDSLILPVAEELKRTVLYIEDNLSNLKLMERMLRGRSDIKLLSAMQGSLGLEIASQHQPDLILLDLHLPDIMGHEVLRRLQSDPLTQDIPVVVVSADATQHEIERLLAAGANDYLTKPLDVRLCLQVMNKALEMDGKSGKGLSSGQLAAAGMN